MAATVCVFMPEEPEAIVGEVVGFFGDGSEEVGPV
jgi:hypothetical protein